MLSVEAGGPRSASGSLRSLTAGVSRLRVLDPGRLGHCWRPPSVGAARRPLPRCPAGGCDLPAAPRGGPRCAPSCREAAPERGRPGLGPWGRGGGRGPSVARHWPGSCAGGTGEAHVRSRLADKGARCSLSSTVFFLSYRREYLDPARLSEALGFALRSEGRRCAVARGPTCPCALLPAASWSRRPAEAPASAAPKRACPGTRRCLPEASSPRRGAGVQLARTRPAPFPGVLLPVVPAEGKTRVGRRELLRSLPAVGRKPTRCGIKPVPPAVGFVIRC